MAWKGNRTINLPAPYLKRLWLDPSRVKDREAYPFCLPIFPDDFELNFEAPITIIVGENGTGKSTILEGIAALAGYDDAGGGKGYMPVDHSEAREKMGGQLSKALRASWLPKITNGWFFRAESFFLGRAISGQGRAGCWSGRPRFPVALPRRGFPALFRRTLPAPGHFYLRRAGICAVAGASDRVFEAAATHGGLSHLPGHHGDPRAPADGLSQCAAAAARQIRARADNGGADGSLPGDAGILRRPARFRRGDVGGIGEGP